MRNQKSSCVELVGQLRFVVKTWAGRAFSDLSMLNVVAKVTRGGCTYAVSQVLDAGCLSESGLLVVPVRAGAEHVRLNRRLRHGPLGGRDTRCSSHADQPGHGGEAHTTDRCGRALLVC